MQRKLALTTEGLLSYCTVPEDKRGTNGCNHKAHQEEGQSIDEFMSEVEENVAVDKEVKETSLKPTEEVVKNDSLTNENTNLEMSQADIDNYALEIDRIAGQKVTPDNMEEVLSKLPPEKLQQINEIGFKAAPEFSLPISDEQGSYLEADTENKIYFSDLPKHGIAGKSSVVSQMFEHVGTVPSSDGEVNIEGNYKEGLTDKEYFKKQFSARQAAISKTVSVAKPGFVARKLFYALSDIEMQEDCESKTSTGILDCKIPGGICTKCAKKDGLNKPKGTMMGSIISTNISEPLTQISMREFHTGGAGLVKSKDREIINNTLDGFKTSPIIQEASEASNTEEGRKIIFDGLKREYAKHGVEMDDYNLKMIAKKLTSYKRENGKLRLVQDDEKFTIVSLPSIGNYGNPLKRAELGQSYNSITKPTSIKINPDSSMYMMPQFDKE